MLNKYNNDYRMKTYINMVYNNAMWEVSSTKSINKLFNIFIAWPIKQTDTLSHNIFEINNKRVIFIISNVHDFLNKRRLPNGT